MPGQRSKIMLDSRLKWDSMLVIPFAQWYINSYMCKNVCLNESATYALVMAIVTAYNVQKIFRAEAIWIRLNVKWRCNQHIRLISPLSQVRHFTWDCCCLDVKSLIKTSWKEQVFAKMCFFLCESKSVVTLSLHIVCL